MTAADILRRLQQLTRIATRGGTVIGWGTQPPVGQDGECFAGYVRLPIAEKGDISDIVFQLVLGQLFAYYYTVNLRREIDRPRNLAKSVTVRESSDRLIDTERDYGFVAIEQIRIDSQVRLCGKSDSKGISTFSRSLAPNLNHVDCQEAKWQEKLLTAYCDLVIAIWRDLIDRSEHYVAI